GVGLEPRRRTAFTVPTPGVSHGPLVATSAFDFYAKPEAGEQLLLSPADQEPVSAQDIRHDEIDVARAIDAAQPFLLPQLRSVTSAWAGLRTFAPDEGPVLGIDADASSFVWCCGQGGTGIQTAVAAGRVVAAAVLGNEIPDDVTAAGVLVHQIDPGRFRS
ncbi:MAG: FAD-binding oxidoreductase, partial [Actinobacteria bacterium]|nr:FAD-binding oxidoreductase [Actinomycetota bacterium]